MACDGALNGQVDREPHPVTNLDSIRFEHRVASIGSEHIPLNAFHPKSQALIKTEIVDVGSRGTDYDLSAAS